MGDAIAGAPDRRRRVLLFYVGVKGVEVDAAVGMVHLVNEPHRLVQHVEVVDLETVDDLLGQDDAFALRVLGGVAQMLDRALPLVIGRAATREHAEGDLVGAAEDG